ncbi:MAG TPA: toll/interleukin-1 receptor domain-containing protein [Thermoanaerobaculia bacterium]|jgi:hypothetical protein|nr:toll/interleukin-1 receptor domain-containing protein [Thermoanaerobaculia bacterium]
MTARPESRVQAEIIKAFTDAQPWIKDEESLTTILLFLLFLLTRRDTYASKVGCPTYAKRWIHFLLTEYAPTKALAAGTKPYALAPPDHGVRRRVTFEGNVELGPHNWPESEDPQFSRRRYDVCISFASEQRDFARALAEALKTRDLRVFFDEDERTDLWGKDLFKRLFQIYGNESEYCVVLFSEAYLARAWTNHELRAAQRRTLLDRTDYVLPIVFDSVTVPEEYQTISFLNASETDIELLAENLNDRIWSQIMRYWLSAEEVAEVMNSEIIGDVIQGSVEGEMRKLAVTAGSRSLGAAVVGTLLAFPFTRVTPAVQGLIRYLLFGVDCIGSLFNSRNQYAFASRHARVMRFRASDGVLLLPQTWTDRLAPEIKKRMPHDEGEPEGT